jgi:hypothetical protein
VDLVIKQVEAADVVALSRRALALGDANDPHDPAFLAALIRRAAAIVCPCAASTLARAVFESLDKLSEESDRLREEIEDAVEKATIAGDLLELGQVATDDPNAKGTWLFAAPPAFVARRSESVFILGVTPDEPSPLPPSIAARIAFERHYRIIRPEPPENLPETFRELGLLELSERSWLKLPREERARELKERIERELQARGPSGDVPDLLILDSARDPSYYKGRWVAPKRETGCYIARRPQAYGAPLWGLASLTGGSLQKFLDFPRRRDKWRGSDFAWHLQMAIDSCRGTPQRYRRSRTTSGTRLDFFSPVPLWAERRLAIIGEPVERDRCLFSYQIPESEIATEEKFLQTYLWLVASDSSQEAS